MSERPDEFRTGLRREDLSTKQARFVRTPWGEFALYESDGALYCAQAFCPHMEGPLFEGSVHDGVVTCPWHAWRFALADGARVDEADPGCRLATCAVTTDPDGILVLHAPRPV